MNNIPTLQDLQKFVVNREGWEVIKQSFYDSAAYPTTGVSTLTFFQLPVGQSSKTQSDTNMTLAGQLPANQGFLIEGIEILFEPSTPTVAASMPAAQGAEAAATGINDAYIFYRSGNLNLTIGSKPYLQEGPLMKFPPSANFNVSGALSAINAATGQGRIAFGKAQGRPYALGSAPIFLTSNQNFSVTLAWPEGLQTVTSAAKVFVSLFGLLYRRSQ